MTMVEKMARAIDPAAWTNVDNRAWIGSALDRQRNATAAALAALEAVREVEFDDPLNEAGWVMISAMEKHGPVTPLQFNNMKSCLRDALAAYIGRAIQEHAATAIGNRRA